jgi:hypothetical protein
MRLHAEIAFLGGQENTVLVAFILVHVIEVIIDQDLVA